MIIHNDNVLSESQALTATAASTNVIDLSSARQVGIGEKLSLVLLVTAEADDANADETYVAQLQTDDNAAFASAASVGDAITITRGAPVGTRIVRQIPDSGVEQFLRVNFTLGGTTPSVGVSAFILPSNNVDSFLTYPDNVTIS